MLHDDRVVAIGMALQRSRVGGARVLFEELAWVYILQLA